MEETRLRVSRLVCATLLLCGAVKPGCGQGTAGAGQTTAAPVTLQAHARAVLVDVTVTDGKGHALRGLKASDFSLSEDGGAQRIAHFEEISGVEASSQASAPVSQETLPKNTYTNAKSAMAGGSATVFLLDGLDTRPGSQAYAREQVIKYLKEAPPERGAIAIFSLDTQLHLIQGFTTDLARLTTAMEERSKLIETPIPQTPGYAATRFRMDFLRQAMQQMGTYLGTFPGRKNLIWFTGSVPAFAYDDGSYVGGALHDRETFSFDFAQTADVLTLGRVSVYPVDAEGLRTDPAYSAASGRQVPLNSANRFGAEEFNKHADLEGVAEATGGRAFYNTNGIKQAIAEVVDSGSNYYTLMYYPTNKDWHGEFRRLKVSAGVANAKLEYRKGYYAVKNSENGSMRKPSMAGEGAPRRQITNHVPGPFVQAMQLGAVDPGSIVFKAFVQVGSSIDKRAKDAPATKDNFLQPKYRDKPFREFTVQYWLDAKQLRLVSQATGQVAGSAEFVVLVLDDHGALVNSEEATLEMNLKPATYAALRQNGLKMPVTVAVPVKGEYFLRIGVHDLSSDRAGALEVAAGEVSSTR